eukprot:TRINITY_DN86726_c0_g1_i1.p1 TRINITY_DN86726_c0_g1~~TRINITY_DN86726_c0_g1_i1.p1  ORF type:complete len:862 (-),score=50.70 TRINITY_DN86726_c0_g1_i1:81-2666(-)
MGDRHGMWRDTSPPPRAHSKRTHSTSTRYKRTYAHEDTPHRGFHQTHSPEASPRSMDSMSMDSGFTFFDGLDSRSGKIKEQRGRLESELRTLRSEARHSSRELRVVEGEAHKLQRLTQNQAKEIQILEEQKIQLLEEISLFQQHSASLHNKMQSLQAENDGFQAAHRRIETDTMQHTRHLQDEVGRLEHDRLRIAEQLTNIEGVLAVERTKTTQLEDRVGALSSERDNLLRRLRDDDGIRMDRDTSRQQLRELQADFEILKQNHSTLQQEHARAIAEQDGIMKQMNMSDHQVQKAREESSSLRLQIDRMREQLQAAESALGQTKANLNVEHMRVIEERDVARQKALVLDNQASQLVQEKNVLQLENNAIKADLMQTAREMQMGQTDYAEMQEENKMLRGECSELRGKLRAAEAEMQQLHSTIAHGANVKSAEAATNHRQLLQLQEEYNQTKDELDRCRAELAKYHKQYSGIGSTILGTSASSASPTKTLDSTFPPPRASVFTHQTTTHTHKSRYAPQTTSSLTPPVSTTLGHYSSHHHAGGGPLTPTARDKLAHAYEDHDNILSLSSISSEMSPSATERGNVSPRHGSPRQSPRPPPGSPRNLSPPRAASPLLSSRPLSPPRANPTTAPAHQLGPSVGVSTPFKFTPSAALAPPSAAVPLPPPSTLMGPTTSLIGSNVTTTAMTTTTVTNHAPTGYETTGEGSLTPISMRAPSPPPALNTTHSPLPKRPSLGIELKMLDDNNGGKDTKAVVHSVFPNSPAAKAGIQAGDVLETWNNIPLTSKEVFQTQMNGALIGSIVTLMITRNGRPLQQQVVISGTARERAPTRRVRSRTRVSSPTSSGAPITSSVSLGEPSYVSVPLL